MDNAQHMIDNRSKSQVYADWVTEFSGSWPFVAYFGGICILWVLLNLAGVFTFDAYPFLFLNWVLTIVSTFQSPLIMMSQNRQNDNDKEKTAELFAMIENLHKEISLLRKERNERDSIERMMKP